MTSVIMPKVTIGDLGCSGVDVAKWRAANTVKLAKDKVNRWIVCRNIDDNPDENTLKKSLVGFFSKTFEREITDAASQIVDLYNVGPADDIRIIRATREPITGFKDSQTWQRREKLPEGPIPFMKSGNVIYLEVVFNYRGALEEVSWPVAKRGLTSVIGPESFTYCPVEADWLLLETAVPTIPAPPKQTLGTKVEEKTKEAATGFLSMWMGWLLLTGAASCAAVYLYGKFKMGGGTAGTVERFVADKQWTRRTRVSPQ